MYVQFVYLNILWKGLCLKIPVASAYSVFLLSLFLLILALERWAGGARGRLENRLENQSSP